MSNLEHYFENLLFEGKDCRGDVNKNSLTKEEPEAVEACAAYVIYSIFCGRDDFKKFIHSDGELEPIKHGRWIDPAAADCYRCSVCEEYTHMEMPRLLYHHCPNCGARMDGGEND